MINKKNCNLAFIGYFFVLNKFVITFSSYLVMQTAWRERNPAARVKAAHDALEKNIECVPAYILLAEEEATTILQVEKVLKQALVYAEASVQNSTNESVHSMYVSLNGFISYFKTMKSLHANLCFT